MDRFLARMERRFGRYAIENLTTYIVGGMAIAFVLMMAQPRLVDALYFEPHLVMRGQVWRLFTYLFIPPPASGMWTLFAIYVVWLVGSNLESQWGPFKLGAYYFVGMLGTTAAAFVTGGAQGNYFLNLSLFFAFATIFPDYQFYLFFILPVKVKWLGWLSFGYVVYAFAFGDLLTRGAVVASLANYLLFFGGTIVAFIRGGSRAVMRPPGSRASSRPPPKAAAPARACAICGAKEDDDSDFRVCSCEKCKAATGGATRTLCLEHARNH